MLHPGVVFKKNKKILKPRGETGGIQISMVMACLVTEVVTEKNCVGNGSGDGKSGDGFGDGDSNGEVCCHDNK